MHAYLIIGSSEKGVADSVEKLLKKLKAFPYEFRLNKIDDARYLAKLTSLAIAEPSAYIIRDVHLATTEALNSFLKNLEEPQKDLYYILTAPSAVGLLPTIVSRCEVIKIRNSKTGSDFIVEIRNEDIEKFLNKTTGERLAYCDKIKDRGEAINFVQGIINYLHAVFVSALTNHTNLAANLETATASLNNLKANGNINLQLTNMSIRLIISH